MSAASGLQGLLTAAVDARAVTAIAASSHRPRRREAEAAAGCRRRSGPAPVTPSSLFDLASLTKPITATLALVLDGEGVLPLRRTVGSALREVGVTVTPALARKSLGALLRHRAGFKAWAPLFHLVSKPSEVLEYLVSDSRWLGAPASTYSDLGYMVWATLAERLTGSRYLDLVRSRVARPLGIRLSGPPGDGRGVVECRLGNDRERELAQNLGFEIGSRRAPAIGSIQDGNARFLGGPAGHAGLFGSARSMAGLASEWSRPGKLLTRQQVTTALSGSGSHGIGWRRRPAEAAGRPGLWYGHVGFTGGGVWFCPQTREVRVLLAHRSKVSVRLDPWRERFLRIDTS